MFCRICHSSNLTKFLDLGFTPPADDFLSEKRLEEPEIHYPLDVFICNNCSLVQLGYVVPPEILYQKDYPYEASMTKTGSKHFHSFAKTIFTRFNLSKGDLVVDIGSNVGVLLHGFKKQGARVFGVEPAKNICNIAQKEGIETINDFFSKKLALRIVKSDGKAKVVTATNVFAHVDNLYGFMRDLDLLLMDRGVFIIEAPYLLNLIRHLQYDTIYHEHLSYLSVKPLDVLFHKFGMMIFDIEEVSIHGGSLRYFIARKGDYPVSNNVSKFIELEHNTHLYEKDTLNNFAKSVQMNREELTWMLRSIKHKGKRIAGVSAPAKGMTLLNYCRIGPELLDFVTEKSSLKIGKYTPGTHIPILPDSELIKQMPDYALLLAWNFMEEIIKNLEDYREAGGKFIIPIPKPCIIG